jgi:hypothetical protein
MMRAVMKGRLSKYPYFKGFKTPLTMRALMKGRLPERPYYKGFETSRVGSAVQGRR